MLRTIVLSLAVLLSCISAKADPVTGGFYSISGIVGTNASFGFSGTNFSVNGLASTTNGINFPARFACPCISGTSISLSSGAFLDQFDFNFGTLTLNGTSYPITFADMQIAAGTVIVPNTSDSAITLTAPFTMTIGNVSGGGHGVNFAGSGGIASLSLNRYALDDALGHPQYVFDRLTYTFVAPTPEPSTIFLFTTSALGLLVKGQFKKTVRRISRK